MQGDDIFVCPSWQEVEGVGGVLGPGVDLLHYIIPRVKLVGLEL